MSRVSSKSSLSPSATRGSSAIDLGKDSGVDMGRKSQPSVSSGGIGVTREVANIGGVSVTGGVAVDVSPINLDISGNPNYEDPSKSSISIAGGAEIPGGIIGVGGGVTINTNTGQIEGGSISGEVIGFGVEVSKSSEGVGFGISFQIPGTPISIEFGFGFPDKKEPAPTPTPTPTPTPINWPTGNSNAICRCVVGGRREFVSIVDPSIKSLDIVSASVSSSSNIVVTFSAENFYSVTGSVQRFGPDSYPFSAQTFVSAFGVMVTSYGGRGNASGYMISGRYSSIIEYVTSLNRTQSSRNFLDTNAQSLVWIDCTPPLVSPPSSFPPPPNPPPRKEMDECCRDSIKLLREIHKRLGIQKFPGELPSTIIQTVEKGQQPAEPPQEKIEDFADLLMWMFQRDDERWGQWQIQIDVKDSDLTKEGDQGKQIKFPNLAESIAEMEGQILSLQANVEALVAISTRNLCESGMGRQEAIKAYLASMAIAKYMNFPYEEADIEVPSTFTPKAESIDELIKESTIHVKGVEYNAKESQRDIFLDLLQAAAITRAVHWRQVDPKKDIKSQILESIKGSADLSEKLENPIANDDYPSKPKHVKDWEDFLDQVEDGFGFEAGIEDAQTPYGRSRDRRPRIRQIGENIGQAGKGNG